MEPGAGNLVGGTPSLADGEAMVQSRPQPVQVPAYAGFELETVRLVSRLRELFAALVRGLPTRVSTASELQRATRLDMKLCWKVFRVMNAPDGLSAAQYVPGPSNMRDLLKTMARLGAPASLLKETEEAGERFERLVKEHAADRRTFDSMVCGFAPADSERVDLRQRRAAFQANSHVWGVQAEAMVGVLIQRPARSQPGKLDEIGLRGDFGMRRLRPTDMPLFQFRYATLDYKSREYSAGRRRPLTEESEVARGAGASIGLIPRFCTKPLPEVKFQDDAEGRTTATLMHSGLGMKASVDLVAGCVMLDSAPRYRGGDERHCWTCLQVGKPCRVAIVDLIVEEGTLPPNLRPRGFMSARNNMVPPIEDLWTVQQLCESEPAVRLGRGPEMLATAEVPCYPELIEWAIRRAGWDPSRFEAWRLRIEYPVTLSSVGLVYDLPEP